MNTPTEPWHTIMDSSLQKLEAVDISETEN